MKTFTCLYSLLLSLFVATGCNSSESRPTPPSPTASAKTNTPALPVGHPDISGAKSTLPPGHPNIDMSAQQLPPGTDAVSEKNPQWTAPADWKPGRSSMVRRASFTTASTDGQNADISVTVFPGDVGGMPSNVNRWRGQLGLAPVAADKLTSIVTPVKINNVDGSSIVDFTADAAPTGKSHAQRMVVVVYPREGNSWFFKMTGDAPLVGAQKENLIKFVQSAKF
jgi:hypothetical protein